MEVRYGRCRKTPAFRKEHAHGHAQRFFPLHLKKRSHSVASGGAEPAGEGPRICPWSPVKDDLGQTAGKRADLLTCTVMVGGDGVDVPVRLVARSTRRKFLVEAVLAVDVVGAPTVE